MTEAATPRVDPANADQLRAWDGAQGAYWADRADRFDEGVTAYRAPLLSAAAPGPAEDVLDIGCGSGQTTRDVAHRATDGSVLGVDLSSRMLALARGRAEHDRLAHVRFQQADAQVHPFPERSFDLAVSRHGAMFFGDAVAAFTNLARALRPGGRLVLLTWQPWRRNEWISAFRAALSDGREVAEPSPTPRSPGPFSLGDPESVRGLLDAAGFARVRLTGLEEPMYFGRDVDDASRFVTGQFAAMLDGLDEDGRTRARANLRADLAAHHTERGVFYDSAAWLVEAQRR